MQLSELVLENRTRRRFYQDVPVERQTLVELVDLARLSPSAGNRQPLKFMLSWEPVKNAVIFANIGWAGYLPEWGGPKEGEKPSAYIIILNDTEISKQVIWDHGIVAQSMMLGAVEKGLGGCIIGNIKKKELAAALKIQPRFEILLVLALGKPKEKVVIDTVGPDGDIKYWRDAQQVHHVPKRKLDDIIVD